MIWSSLGELVILLLLLIGAGLFVFYRENPPTDPIVLTSLGWSGGHPSETDGVLPIWIVTEMPVLLRGLLLTSIFAAAISSLDSLLAALSQTTLSLFRRTRGDFTEEEEARLLRFSRVLVLGWGAVLIGGAIALMRVREETDIDFPSLALGITAYTVGPLLGMFLVALHGRGIAFGLFFGTFLSILFTTLVRSDFALPLVNDESLLLLSEGPTYQWITGLCSEWVWPITTLITIACGWDYRRKTASVLSKT